MLHQHTLEQLYTLRLTGMADAILDRLLHTAHRLPLKGESLRKRQQNNLDTENPGS